MGRLYSTALIVLFLHSTRNSTEENHCYRRRKSLKNQEKSTKNHVERSRKAAGRFADLVRAAEKEIEKKKII
jgi:hypothetical protein